MEAEQERARVRAGDKEWIGGGILYISPRDTKVRARSILEEWNNAERRKVMQIYHKHAFPSLPPMIYVSLVTDVLTFMPFSLFDLRLSNDPCVFSNTSTVRTKAPVNTRHSEVGYLTDTHPLMICLSTLPFRPIPTFLYSLPTTILNASHQKLVTSRRIPFRQTNILQSRAAMMFLGAEQNRRTGRLSSSSLFACPASD